MPIVKLFGNLRSFVDDYTVDIPGTTIGEILITLCKDNDELHAAIFDGDSIHSYIRIIFNGRDIELLQGIQTTLEPEDEIAIFPPISGGRD
jgi:molybdopterin synthase sulfur carrier subunit